MFMRHLSKNCIAFPQRLQYQSYLHPVPVVSRNLLIISFLPHSALKLNLGSAVIVKMNSLLQDSIVNKYMLMLQ